jgi:hypothetical protein
VTPSAINPYGAQHPGEFLNSTERRVAMVDINRHPLRQGKPVSIEELLAADRARDGCPVQWTRLQANARLQPLIPVVWRDLVTHVFMRRPAGGFKTWTPKSPPGFHPTGHCLRSPGPGGR